MDCRKGILDLIGVLREREVELMTVKVRVQRERESKYQLLLHWNDRSGDTSPRYRECDGEEADTHVERA